MTERDDEIRKQVEERIAQDAATGPPSRERPTIDGDFISRCLVANEHGDGTLYAELFRDRFLFCKNNQEWYEWGGHLWKRDIMGRSSAAVEIVVDRYLSEYKSMSARVADIVSTHEDSASAEVLRIKKTMNQILKRVSQLRGRKRRSACIEFAHTCDNPIAITGEEFDNYPMLFPCANGVLDLETGRMCSGRPGDYLTKGSPIEYRGIDTPAPLWEKTLLEIFGNNEELVAYMQRLAGYSMTGIVNEKVFPVLYGKTGWNGRSLLVETISYVMGDLAGPIPSEMLLSSKYAKSSSGPTPDVMSLKGIRMAFASEIDEGQRFSAAKIKWLTGKDELVGRHPHDKYPTHFQPTHKLFLMTNTQPEAPPNDKAFWERLHLIPFLISFVNRDPQESYERRAIVDLDRQIKQEAPGILAWLLRGCLLYQRHGLSPPKIITEATEQYRRDEDLLADFIDECCLREPGAKEKSSVLYKRFVDWYHDNVGQKEKSGTWFGKQLSQKFEKSKEVGCNTYHGICLNDGYGGLEG